jgi:hypothetical protein
VFVHEVGAAFLPVAAELGAGGNEAGIDFGFILSCHVAVAATVVEVVSFAFDSEERVMVLGDVEVEEMRRGKVRGAFFAPVDVSTCDVNLVRLYAREGLGLMRR